MRAGIAGGGRGLAVARVIDVLDAAKASAELDGHKTLERRDSKEDSQMPNNSVKVRRRFVERQPYFPSLHVTANLAVFAPC